LLFVMCTRTNLHCISKRVQGCSCLNMHIRIKTEAESYENLKLLTSTSVLYRFLLSAKVDVIVEATSGRQFHTDTQSSMSTCVHTVEGKRRKLCQMMKHFTIPQRPITARNTSGTCSSVHTATAECFLQTYLGTAY